MADIRQSSSWANFMENLGWESFPLITDKSSSFAYVRKLPLIGSLVKIPKVSTPIPLSKIESLAKEKKALFVKLEPDCYLGDQATLTELRGKGFVEDTWSLQPTKTIVIDISASPDEILSKMEKDTRYSIRAAEKRGVESHVTQDLEIFWKLYEETSKRGRFWIMRKELEELWKAFSKENKATIIFARFAGEPLAAAFLLFEGKTAYYYHAASSAEHRQVYATYSVVWKSILEAKKRGCHYFDLMGIEDSRISSTKNWAGFSHFKRGFGGDEKIYLGSFIKFYNPVMKILFTLNRFF